MIERLMLSFLIAGLITLTPLVVAITLIELFKLLGSWLIPIMLFLGVWILVYMSEVVK